MVYLLLGERHILIFTTGNVLVTSGSGEGGGVGVMTFLNANIANYSKSNAKNNKPVNIAHSSF